MKWYHAIALCLGLAACGGGSTSAPRNLDNACSILQQRPGYLAAFQATERKWGVPVSVQMATIYQESKFISNARPPQRFALGVIPTGRASTALGYGQALDGTWDEYVEDQGRWRAKRTRIRDASDFMGWYMVRSASKNGIPLWDARNQYLAYHEGHTGFARGSYNRKGWLVRVADQVASRAALYQRQLPGCRARS